MKRIGRVGYDCACAAAAMAGASITHAMTPEIVRRSVTGIRPSSFVVDGNLCCRLAARQPPQPHVQSGGDGLAQRKRRRCLPLNNEDGISMRHRTFGRSGIKVSEIVRGGGAVGGILIHTDDATKREAIRRAIGGGINWSDTAAQYGGGRSEEALAWLLPEAGATPYL